MTSTLKKHFQGFTPILMGIGIFAGLTVLRIAIQMIYYHLTLKSVDSPEVAAHIFSKSNPVLIVLNGWGLANYFIAGFVTAKMSQGNKLLSSVLTGVGIVLVIAITVITLTFIAIQTQVEPLAKRFPNNPKEVQITRDRYNAVITSTLQRLPSGIVKAAFYTLIGGGIYVVKTQQRSPVTQSSKKKTVKKK